MKTFMQRMSASVVLAFSALWVFAVAAFAEPTPEEVVGSAVASAASSATSIVSTGIPVILGVAALWVALKFGRRLLAKI